MSVSKRYSQFLPLIIFHLVFFVILGFNFPFGQYFLGWDALSPEFNFWLNFKRAIFASWQENYGVGLIGGHGFATTLPHTIITFLMSLVLPTSAVRPAFTFLCLYIGGLGMFFLIRLILQKINQEGNKIQSSDVRPEDSVPREFRVQNLIDFATLFAALFYILNLGTLQMFYVQLETFIAHFASLPWLFWIVLRLIKENSRKNIFLFFIINFFATLQGFIPSLFVAYFVSLVLFLGSFIIKNKLNKAPIIKSIKILFLTLVVNSYWLLPLSYYQFNQNQVFLNSYNNLISTQHFIDINQKYGDYQNVALLKGYLFDSFELGSNLLKPWIDHFQSVRVLIIAYSLSLLSIFGLVYGLIRFKNWYIFGFALIFLYFLASLATNSLPFSIITNILQYLSPTYEQAFRTSFTKFSLGLAFSYSIFIGVAVFVVFSFLSKFLKNRWIFATYALFLICLFYYAWPQISGHYLYKNLKVDLPQAYLDLFSYFKDKEDARIADFPQDCSEGWFTYKWGYFGSGFEWYGLKQPVMARTFDVWSNYNENYYWEVKQALQEQDYARIDSLFQKYQIKWILVDQNLIYCRTQRSFFTSADFFEYLKSSPQYKLVKMFKQGVPVPIYLYENKNYSAQSFVYLKTGLPNIGSVYNWTDNDQVFSKIGDYITSNKMSVVSYFPFRALFSKREEVKNNNWSIDNERDYIVAQSQIPLGLKDYVLKINKYSDLEKNIFVDIILKSNGLNDYQVKAEFKYPQIYLDNQKLVDLNATINLGEFETDDITKLKVFIDGEEINKALGFSNVYPATLYFSLPNNLEIIDQEAEKVLFKWQGNLDSEYKRVINRNLSVVIPAYKEGVLKVYIPKIKDNKLHGIEYTSDFGNLIPKSCSNLSYSENNQYELKNEEENEYIRLISGDSSQCVNLNYSGLITSAAYLIDIKSRNIEGNNLKFSVSNKTRLIYNEVSLNKKIDFKNSYFILPPTFKNEFGYEFAIESISENQKKSINDFAGISVFELPYQFLTSLEINDSGKGLINSKSVSLKINHPNVSFYKVDVNILTNEDYYLILSQGFNQGWKAYKIENEKLEMKNWLNIVFPFIFSNEIKDHVLVNNWENGWSLQDQISNIKDQKSTIIIIFWPQYLEYLGFMILILGFTTCFKFNRR